MKAYPGQHSTVAKALFTGKPWAVSLPANATAQADLKLALDEFRGSMPLAAAAYNAGPNRPRAWRNGPTLEAAIWAETIPYGETRDYVKKVLGNTTNYAALITGQPQSLKARLGTVGPRGVAEPEVNKELP